MGEVLLRPGVDGVFLALSRRRRRHLLLELLNDRVAHENDVMMRGSSVRERLLLRHLHLPLLAEAGYVEWDERSGDLRKGSKFEELAPLLDLIERHADELPAGWP